MTIGVLDTSNNAELKQKLNSANNWNIEELPDSNVEYIVNNANNIEIIIIPEKHPHINPINFNKSLKQSSKLRTIPTVLYSSKLDNIRALSNGFNDIISSRIPAEKVREKIVQIIEREPESNLIGTYFSNSRAVNFLQEISLSNCAIFNYDNIQDYKTDLKEGLRTDVFLIDIENYPKDLLKEIKTISINNNIPVISILNGKLESEKIRTLHNYSLGLFRSYEQIEKEISNFIAHYLGHYQNYNQELRKKWLDDFLEVTGNSTDFKELFFSYLNRILNSINKIELELALGKRKNIHRLSHRLKGNTANYQLKELAQYSKKICNMSRTKEKFDLKKINQEFIKLKALYWGIKKYGK